MSNFQITLIIIFSAIAIVAILIFSGILPGYKTSGGGVAIGPTVTIWSPFSAPGLNKLFDDLNLANKELFSINHINKRKTSYESDLLNALASAKGPDAWFISQDTLLSYKDKIYSTPFSSFPPRTFKDSFIDYAELFLDNQSQSVDAVPVVVDPLVLYWNRDLFASAGIAETPKYWDEFLTSSQRLTSKDGAGNINQSGTAMGGYDNVKNAKEIISLLVLQAGNSIVDHDTMRVVFGDKGQAVINPAEGALSFFNEFSNPKKAAYSWNASLYQSDEIFVQGKLAMYFGYASEYPNIKQRNPHLNFDVAVVPQIRPADTTQWVSSTYGKIYSVVISKASNQRQAILSAIFKMTESDFAVPFADMFYMAPVRRSVLAQGSEDPVASIFYKSAIMTRSWLEPNSKAVDNIFKNMIDATVTGRLDVPRAVRGVKSQLGEL